MVELLAAAPPDIKPADFGIDVFLNNKWKRLWMTAGQASARQITPVAQMNSEILNKWLTLAANLAVLVGIVFLALEIQQSNRIASASMEFGIRQNFISIQEYMLVNDDVAGLLAKSRDSSARFTPTEEERIWGFIYAHLNQWISVELSYRQGLASDFTFEQVKEDIASVVPYAPSMIPFWRQAVDEFRSMDALEITDVIRQELGKFDSQEVR